MNIKTQAGILHPTVAVVILNWNGKAYLQQFLPSVLASTYPALEIFVADNASTDDSVAFLRSGFPAIKIIELQENFGFARGYNEALKHVEADIYVLLNSDVEVSPGWLEPLVAMFSRHPKLGACQPKILSFHNRNMFEYAGAAGGFMDSLGYPFARGRILDVCEVDAGQYDAAIQCFWASGAALCIPSGIYHEMQGLDEFFFAHQEEIDLCWRLQSAGYEVYCEPASVVYHVGGGTLSKINPHKTFLNFRNNLIMMYKNLFRGDRMITLPMRFFLDGAAAFSHLVKGEGQHALAIVKAWVAFLRWVASRNKISIFPQQPKKPVAGWYGGSLLWQFYINGKKHFSEIVRRK
ncbi:MAG: glycosyltransferase family 2 protein [Ferruginibacter sp.]